MKMHKKLLSEIFTTPCYDFSNLLLGFSHSVKKFIMPLDIFIYLRTRKFRGRLVIVLKLLLIKLQFFPTSFNFLPSRSSLCVISGLSSLSALSWQRWKKWGRIESHSLLKVNNLLQSVGVGLSTKNMSINLSQTRIILWLSKLSIPSSVFVSPSSTAFSCENLASRAKTLPWLFFQVLATMGASLTQTLEEEYCDLLKFWRQQPGESSQE